jgi:hypothetical protein
LVLNVRFKLLWVFSCAFAGLVIAASAWWIPAWQIWLAVLLVMGTPFLIQAGIAAATRYERYRRRMTGRSRLVLKRPRARQLHLFDEVKYIDVRVVMGTTIAFGIATAAMAWMIVAGSSIMSFPYAMLLGITAIAGLAVSAVLLVLKLIHVHSHRDAG